MNSVALHCRRTEKVSDITKQSNARHQRFFSPAQRHTQRERERKREAKKFDFKIKSSEKFPTLSSNKRSVGNLYRIRSALFPWRNVRCCDWKCRMSRMNHKTWSTQFETGKFVVRTHYCIAIPDRDKTPTWMNAFNKCDFFSLIYAKNCYVFPLSKEKWRKKYHVYCVYRTTYFPSAFNFVLFDYNVCKYVK